MKHRKIQKKLILNKETVSHLNHDEMQEAHGGKQSGLTCITCSIIVCVITDNTDCTCPTTT
jgi:hypothetical protein